MEARDYLSLPYRITIEADDTAEGPCFVARAAELPGTIGQGENEEEALDDLYGAMEAYVESVLGRGLQVPLPGDMSGVVADQVKLVGAAAAPTVERSPYTLDGRTLVPV
jgi:predicted RNase H-like HicB family nuclease